jgi:[NiFe] hydrogenase diaphorase moiety large subunit
MAESVEKKIKGICEKFNGDRTRLVDILRDVQQCFGQVSSAAIDELAACLKCPRVEVEGAVSFYAFLSEKPKGQIVIRLCNDIIDRLQGVEKVAEVFSQELGIEFGETTKDGKISLEWTPCIGMCDQAPAALVNEVLITKLNGEKARQLVKDLRQHLTPAKLVKEFGDGNNSHDLVRSMVVNNIRQRGEIIFGEMERGAGLKSALAMSPSEVIRAVKTARLRGRGGAGFPAGMKWEFTRGAEGDHKVIICNADEGEPGTFKDRVILTECPDLVFEGMTIAGYAIGADRGLVYLRAEYAYLKPWLEHVLEERRKANLLGKKICGQNKLDFDIRIQMGAGAYVCGEETALISSCEGLRGDPKNRPPFPAQKGYLGAPTCVNNVETLCCVSRILEKGAGWFASFGNDKSTGTKLLSVSGDCRKPGIYEVEFGITIRKLLDRVGADKPLAVQVGGASGSMIDETQFDRAICFEDLATGGSIMIFGAGRDVIEVAEAFMEFFVEESCGYCAPCRVGNSILKNWLHKVKSGTAEISELEVMRDLAQSVKLASRCGLGQSSPNPVLNTLKHFRSVYEERLKPLQDGQRPQFDLSKALEEAEYLCGRKSVHA